MILLPDDEVQVSIEMWNFLVQVLAFLFDIQDLPVFDIEKNIEK
jgi:hypothetical protein